MPTGLVLFSLDNQNSTELPRPPITRPVGFFHRRPLGLSDCDGDVVWLAPPTGTVGCVPLLSRARKRMVFFFFFSPAPESRPQRPMVF